MRWFVGESTDDGLCGPIDEDACTRVVDAGCLGFDPLLSLFRKEADELDYSRYFFISRGSLMNFCLILPDEI